MIALASSRILELGAPLWKVSRSTRPESSAVFVEGGSRAHEHRSSRNKNGMHQEESSTIVRVTLMSSAGTAIGAGRLFLTGGFNVALG
jgi:hypothetical protein